MTGNFRDLILSIFLTFEVTGSGEELQIVDDEKLNPMSFFHASGTSAKVGDFKAWLIIDDHCLLLHHVDRRRQSVDIRCQLRAPVWILSDSTSACEQMIRCKSCSAVISREKIPTGKIVFKADVFGDIESKGCFSHRRSCSQNHEVGRREAIDHFVEIDKMGRNAGDARFFGALA